MNKICLFVMPVVACGLVVLSGSATVAADAANDTAAVRAAVDSYVEAFNRGDAKAVADHFSDDGHWISPAGERIDGREAIQAEMEAYFAEGGNPEITVFAPSVRLLSDTVAVEEGRARVARRGELPTESTYIAIHVKQQDGSWKMDSVRETELPRRPSNFEHLRDLDWLVGTWIDSDESGSVETHCAWTKNQNFLTRSFVVKIDDQIDLEGTQVIGWDAAQQRIRSWIFDSDGGFGEGVWTRDGDRWIVKLSQVLQDGAGASSISIITPIDNNSFTWQSTGREVDGEMQPSVDPVIIVRKPVQ